MEKAVSGWVKLGQRKPKHGQWVVVRVGDGFKAGVFDTRHPFSPAIVDRMEGRFFHSFTHWMPIPIHPEE